MEKRKAPGVAARGGSNTQGHDTMPRKLVNPETGEAMPLFQLPSGTKRIDFKDQQGTGEEFLQMYPAGSMDDMDLRLSPAANAVLRYMEQHLDWGNNLVVAGEILATYDTLTKRYKRTLDWAIRAVSELEKMDFVLRLKGLRGKTHFLMSPHYMYRGYIETRPIVLAAYNGHKGGKVPLTAAEMNGITQQVKEKEAEIRARRHDKKRG